MKKMQSFSHIFNKMKMFKCKILARFCIVVTKILLETRTTLELIVDRIEAEIEVRITECRFILSLSRTFECNVFVIVNDSSLTELAADFEDMSCEFFYRQVPPAPPSDSTTACFALRVWMWEHIHTRKGYGSS